MTIVNRHDCVEAMFMNILFKHKMRLQKLEDSINASGGFRRAGPLQPQPGLCITPPGSPGPTRIGMK